MEIKQVHIDKAKPVPDRLAELAKLYKERNVLYKNDYLEFGAVLLSFFPEGKSLQNEEDFARFGLFVMLLSKVRRYAKNFNEGGHVDSLDDLSVYAQMLQQFDEISQIVKKEAPF